MKISKQTAENLATSLLAKQLEKIQLFKQEIDNKVVEYHNSNLPEVLKNGAPEELKPYIGYAQYIGVYSHPVNEYIYRDELIKYNGCISANLTDVEKKEVVDLYMKKFAMMNDYKENVKTLKNTFITLSTDVKILKEFPEAEDFLKSQTTTTICVSTDKARDIINSLKD